MTMTALDRIVLKTAILSRQTSQPLDAKCRRTIFTTGQIAEICDVSGKTVKEWMDSCEAAPSQDGPLVEFLGSRS